MQSSAFKFFRKIIFHNLALQSIISRLMSNNFYEKLSTINTYNRYIIHKSFFEVLVYFGLSMNYQPSCIWFLKFSAFFFGWLWPQEKKIRGVVENNFIVPVKHNTIINDYLDGDQFLQQFFFAKSWPYNFYGRVEEILAHVWRPNDKCL